MHIQVGGSLARFTMTSDVISHAQAVALI